MQENTRRDVLTGATAALFGAIPATSATFGAAPPSAAAAGTAAPPAAFPAGGREIVPGSPYPTFSRAVKFDRIVFVAGVVGQKPGTRDLVSPDFEPQCRQTLENLRASVEAAGSSLERVLKCTVYITEAANFAAFNKVYVEFFPKDPPARSSIVVKDLVVPGALLEVDCVTSL